MSVDSALAFAFIEQPIDVFFGHETLLGFLGIVERLASDCLIELGGAVLPIRVGVDGAKDVRYVGRGRGQRHTLFDLPTTALVLFVHLNDYYYNTHSLISPQHNSIYLWRKG